jgi:hypothetical protein
MFNSWKAKYPDMMAYRLSCNFIRRYWTTPGLLTARFSFIFETNRTHLSYFIVPQVRIVQVSLLH